MPNALVLFDIDGTLVRRAGPHHRLALIEAVRLVTGFGCGMEGIPVHGMLDTDILMLMLKAAGCDSRYAAEAMPSICERAQDIYVETVPELHGKTCPGVIDLLEDLRGRETVLALVTGNLERIGWRKLERAGVAHYFEFGAFAGMAETRGGLARLAIERARGESRITIDSPIVLIGDAPQDVQAARENGITSIAVRTGVTPPGDLEACAPHVLLDDLTTFDFAAIVGRSLP